MARTMSHVTQNLWLSVFKLHFDLKPIFSYNILKFDHVPDIRSKNKDHIFSIAHNLSYNILKFGRKLWNNNRDTGHSSSGQRYCENLKMIAHSVFEISSTQNSYRNIKKKRSLRAIYRRWRHPIGRNLVSEYFQMTFWIDNLTMFPTSD